MQNTQEYIKVNKDKFLNELIDLLKIPSISADPVYAQDVKQAGEVIASQMKAIGLDNVQVFPTAGHPIVYGEKIIDANLSRDHHGS